MKYKKFFNLLSVFLITLVFVSCDSSISENKKSNSETPNFDNAELVQLTPERNELAKLMLAIYAKTDALKSQIIKGNAKVENHYLLDLQQITKVKNGIDPANMEAFKEYGKMLTEEAKILQTAEKNQKEAYNHLINSCVVCHEQFCPKMVPKIEKLLIHK